MVIIAMFIASICGDDEDMLHLYVDNSKELENLPALTHNSTASLDDLKHVEEVWWRGASTTIIGMFSTVSYEDLYGAMGIGLDLASGNFGKVPPWTLQAAKVVGKLMWSEPASHTASSDSKSQNQVRQNPIAMKPFRSKGHPGLVSPFQ